MHGFVFVLCMCEGKGRRKNWLFVLELHEQREVGNHKDNISSYASTVLSCTRMCVRTHTHNSRICWERNELQLTAGGGEPECSAE